VRKVDFMELGVNLKRKTGKETRWRKRFLL